MGLLYEPLGKAFHTRSGLIPCLLIISASLLIGGLVTILVVKEEPFKDENKVAHQSIFHGMRDQKECKGKAKHFSSWVWVKLKGVWKAVKEPFASSDFAWVFITRALFSSGFYMTEDFLQYYFDDVIKKFNVFGWFTLNDAAAATSLFVIPLLIGATITTILGGILSDKYGRKLMVYISCGLQLLTVILLIFFCSFELTIFLGLIFGMGYGMV